ncbi:uncharacterized protein LOC112508001 [Cynara cardunculus var. scolymus]|uniref:uncharacterized protein LOC112508001 n=1 Tax=Cynara cardunculus var. scolymus TaxID=59895 RepID=UPI000D628EE5|nr:uncharacterized protein LOC112508001 [Cynara cardunculus var. scolymus]
MEFNKLFGFLGILKKSIKIMLKNGRLLAIVTSIYLIIAPVFYVWNISTIKPIIFDFSTKSIQLASLDPRGLPFSQDLASILKDIKVLLGIELAFLLALFLTSLFAQTAIIFLTEASYKSKKIYVNDLMVRVPRSSTRLFITCFHVALLRVGYIYFGFVTLMVPTIMFSGHKIVSKVILWVLMIFLVILYLYLSVVWLMSSVISVLEECSGIEALGKAGKLVKGNKLEGFSLNLMFNLLAYAFYHVLSKRSAGIRTELTQAFLQFFLMSCICLLVVLELQAYAVFYFECKKSHGEEIELQGSVEYSKISNMPLVIGEDLA